MSLPEEFAELCSIEDDSEDEDDEMRAINKIARGFNSFSRIQNGKIGKNSLNHLKPNHQFTHNGQNSNFSGFAPFIPAATAKFPSLFKKLDADETSCSFDKSSPPCQDDNVTPTFVQLNELIANDDDFDQLYDEIMAKVVNQQSGNSDGEQFSNDNEHLGLVAQQGGEGEGRDSGIGDNNDGHHDGENEVEEEEEGDEVEGQEEEEEEQMGEEEVKTEENELLGEEEEESADPDPVQNVAIPAPSSLKANWPLLLLLLLLVLFILFVAFIMIPNFCTSNSPPPAPHVYIQQFVVIQQYFITVVREQYLEDNHDNRAASIESIAGFMEGEFGVVG